MPSRGQQIGLAPQHSQPLVHDMHHLVESIPIFDTEGFTLQDLFMDGECLGKPPCLQLSQEVIDDLPAQCVQVCFGMLFFRIALILRDFAAEAVGRLVMNGRHGIVLG